MVGTPVDKSEARAIMWQTVTEFREEVPKKDGEMITAGIVSGMDLQAAMEVGTALAHLAKKMIQAIMYAEQEKVHEEESADALAELAKLASEVLVEIVEKQRPAEDWEGLGESKQFLEEAMVALDKAFNMEPASASSDMN